MIHRHLLGVGLLILLAPVPLPPFIEALGGIFFGVGFWLWLSNNARSSVSH